MTRNWLILWRRWIRVASLLLLAFMHSQAPAAGPRRVLIVHSYGPEFAPFNLIVATFRNELARQSAEPLEFHEVSLDTARYEETTAELALVNYLRALFAQRPLDLIVTTAEPASLFAAKHRESLFPTVPVVAVLNQRMMSTLAGTTNMTIVPIGIDLPLLIENILQPLPMTTNVAMVLGASQFERYWTAQCQREFAPFTNRIAVSYLNDLSFDQIQARVANLPPNSAVLYGMLAIDAAGVPYEQERALSGIHAKANAPIFGVLEHHLGNGIVGGRLISMEALGREVAGAGLLSLQGRKPPEVRPTGPGRPTYDWRELRRWGISEKGLPPGSEVRFREPSQWEQHKWEIIGSVVLCMLEGGLIVGLLAQLRRRQRAEETLRQSEERLSLATSGAKVGVWSWDIERGTIEATPECKQIFGWAPDKVVSFEMFKNRVHPEDRAAVQQALKEAIDNRLIYDKQYRIVGENRQACWVSARGQCRYRNGQAVDMQGVLVDITERRAAEQEAAQHRADLAHLTRVNTVSELSGSLAHELNQPLGIILSNAQAAQRLLTKEPPDLVEVRQILADVVSADRRAGDVIQRVRTLLKRGDVSFQPVALNEVIKEVLHLLNSELIERGVTVIRDLAPDLPSITGDRVQLEQLFLNLIVNGADAMSDNAPGTRQLDVKTVFPGQKIRVSVRDRGAGLPSDTERLFQPFFTTKPHGLGMGLTICRSIATAHQGRLWAEPCPEGGAIFHLELPSARP